MQISQLNGNDLVMRGGVTFRCFVPRRKRVRFIE